MKILAIAKVDPRTTLEKIQPHLVLHHQMLDGYRILLYQTRCWVTKLL